VIGILERMTAKRPVDRFNSMLEVAKALQPFAARDAVNVNLRALLRARAKTHHRERSASSSKQAKPSSPGSVTDQRETALSDLRSLEALMRRVSDELTEPRAENRRLQVELQQLQAERTEREQCQAELHRIREQLEQYTEENSRLNAEADEAKNVIASLRSRCTEFEKSLAEYKQQIHAITQQARDLSAEIGTLQEGLWRGEARNQTLRAAYDQATSSPDTGDTADSFDEIFADDSLVQEIARSRWGTHRTCSSARTQHSSRERGALAGV
jgi:chromosome segregation ATPase